MGLLDFISKKKKPMVNGWPFSDAPNTIVFTNKHVVSGKLITAVYHDEEDASWQFHTNDPDTNSNAVVMLVALSEVASIDPTILKLAQMPVGHQATRSSRHTEWIIEKHANSDED
jgi:hypothetical protein